MEGLRKLVREIFERTVLAEAEAVRTPFSFRLPDNVIELSGVFQNGGFELYVVGGAVRDMILGKEPKDYDLVSDATPDEVEEMLAGKYRTIPTGKAFGIITVVMPDGEEYEIAKYREDLGGGRRPEGGVRFSTIDQDVKRRDLTINALYYDIAKQEIIDYVGGVGDIKTGNVKTVGSAEERFGEDRLRILRAVRFAARFGSQLDKGIQDALEKDNSLEGISKERIRDEFLKGIESAQSVVKFLETLDRFGLLSQILEGLDYDKVDFIEESDSIILLANLLKGNAATEVRARLAAQRYTLEEISKITFLVLFRSFDPSVAVRMKKLEKISGVTEGQIRKFARWNSMDMKTVEAFLKFVFSVSSEELMSQGYKGRELGQEIERRETERFLRSL